MTPQRANSIHLDRMRNAIQQALEFTAHLDYDGFAADARTFFATERTLEMAGGAVKLVPEEVRSLDPEIPWRHIADLGDFILDHYDEVNLQEVWGMVQGDMRNSLPRLERLQHVVEQREREERDDC